MSSTPQPELMGDGRANELEVAKRYLRPLKLALLMSVGAEAGLFVVFGLILYPEGSVIHKLLWTVVFCGLGMGGALGASICLLVVDRLQGWAAVVACAALSMLLIGFACDYLCLSLDKHFHYFGGADNAGLFIGVSVALAGLGGALGGALLFTPKGQEWLARIGW